MKHPKTLLLLSGRVVDVVRTHYPYAKNTWRVEYVHAENHNKGCIAELMYDRFEEVEPRTTVQTKPAPLTRVTEDY